MAASTTPPNVVLRCARGSLSLAEVNAGKFIVNRRPGITVTVVDGWIRSHGTGAGNTSVDVVDTKGTLNLHAGTHAITFTRAGTVLNDHITTWAGATNTVVTGLGTPLTKGEGIKIVNVGSALTTTTTLDYCIYYYLTA